MPPRPRKRKVLKVVRQESDSGSDEEPNEEQKNLHNSTMQQGPMYTIMSNAQLNETFHKKYIKEMQQLYSKMDHDAFMYTFIKMIKSAMEAEEANEYASTSLEFCAKYISSYNSEDTHPVLISIFKWLLSTISNSPHIRFRLCQFVNLVLNALGPEAALDDCICDNILSYMINRLKDLNPNVRVQAILALQRLQIPENPDDAVVKAYQFHLSCDPSPRVRQAVITSMGRNYNTIPYILERLWDVDEKVRRHTYLCMSSYPTRSYKVVQRLTFLEQGLNDRSEKVQKVVTSVLLPQWFESYNKDYIALISALKIDSSEAEMDRFRKITKLALREIFKRQKIEDIVKSLPIDTDPETEFYKCIPITQLSIENSLFWFCLIEYLQNDMADELDEIIPELSLFCTYVLRYCELHKYETDKWKKMEYQYTFLTLMEIINTFDLGDEIGRENLKQLLCYLLKNFDTDEHVIKVIARCAENLIVSQEERLQFFVDIIKEIFDSQILKPTDFSNTVLEELLEKQSDQNLKLKIFSLKVKIMELEEQEMNYVNQKDYVQAQRCADERTACTEEFAELLKPMLDISSNSDNALKTLSVSFNKRAKKITSETIIKCLQIAFHIVVSKKVKSLTPNVCTLYKDFIRRHVESNQLAVREWALKCGTAYSMLYDQLSKDVYSELYCQFYKNHNARIWKTAIECIFELLQRYGFAHFELEDKPDTNKARKSARQLHTMDITDGDEEISSTSTYGVDLIYMMSQFLNTCDEVSIKSAIVTGFCGLLLHGHLTNNEFIVEKLLLKYFNPTTDPEINQILGVFFDNLITKKKQQYLQPCLLPTIRTILRSTYDSPLREIKPETVLRFVIDATQPMFCRSGQNIHNKIALSFIQEMLDNVTNKELIRLLSKELITLQVMVKDDAQFRNDLKNSCEDLLKFELDPKSSQNIKTFKDVLDGRIEARVRVNGEGSDEENEGSDEENINPNKITTLTEEPEQQEEEIRNIDGEDQIITEKSNDKEKDSSNIDSQGEGKEAENNQPEENDTESDQTKETEADTAKVTSTTTDRNEDENEETERSSSDNNCEQPLSSKSTEPEMNISNSMVTPNKGIDSREEVEEEEEQQLTPTTFGRDNTTAMRFLRKSLNAKRLSSDDGASRPPKIRIEVRSASKRFEEKTNETVQNGETNKNEAQKGSKKNENDKTMNRNTRKVIRKEINSSIGKEQTSKGNSSDVESLNSDRNDTVEVAETSVSDVVPESPETVSATARKRRHSDKSAKNTNKKNTTVQSTSRRRLILSADMMSPASSSPLRKKLKERSNERLVQSERKTRGKSKKDKTEVEKQRTEATTSRSKSARKEKQSNIATPTVRKVINLTNSVEKRIRTGRNPVLKIPRTDLSEGRMTRNATRKVIELNQVMTRKRRSLDELLLVSRSSSLSARKILTPSISRSLSKTKSSLTKKKVTKTPKETGENGIASTSSETKRKHEIMKNISETSKKQNKGTENSNKYLQVKTRETVRTRSVQRVRSGTTGVRSVSTSSLKVSTEIVDRVKRREAARSVSRTRAPKNN